MNLHTTKKKYITYPKSELFTQIYIRMYKFFELICQQRDIPGGKQITKIKFATFQYYLNKLHKCTLQRIFSLKMTLFMLLIFTKIHLFYSGALALFIARYNRSIRNSSVKIPCDYYTNSYSSKFASG